MIFAFGVIKHPTIGYGVVKKIEKFIIFFMEQIIEILLLRFKLFYIR